jgi:hypothetical protein
MFAEVGKKLQMLVDVFASPNHLLRLPYFGMISTSLTSVQVLLAVYSILLVEIHQRCFADLVAEKEYDLLWPIIVSWLLVLFQFTYAGLMVCCRCYKQMQSNDLVSENRTRLGLCTEGLCKAQKLRIHKTNVMVDFLTLFWVLGLTILMFMTIPSTRFELGNNPPDKSAIEQSYLRDHNYTLCPDFYYDIVPFGMAQIWFLGIVAGLVLKQSVLCSDLDYTSQSRALEKSMNLRPESETCMSTWIQLSEQRVFISTIILIFEALCFFSFAATLCPYFWSPAQLDEKGLRALHTFLSYSYIIIAAFAGILFLVDGGVLLLPRNLRILRDPVHRSKFDLRHWPWELLSIPRKKVVLALQFFIVIAFVMVIQLCHFLLLPSAFGSIILLGIAVGFMNCVRDLQVSVRDLLLNGPDDNFGLVMLKSDFVEELRAAVLQSESLGLIHHVFDLKIRTFLASQARVELATVISYRWSNEETYAKKSQSVSCQCFRLRIFPCDGFDWIVVITKPQIKALIEELSKVSEDYVWMDQFSIPQKNLSGSVSDEERKFLVRNELIPRMTGLYSCAGRVVALNNSGDDLLLESDWYQNRLWCLQEYCLPVRLSLAPIVNLGLYSDLTVLEERREIHNRFFGSSSDVTSCTVILDWLLTSSECLKEKVHARVRQVGIAKYNELVSKKNASDRNDTFSALAQSWYGIIMTSKSTKSYFVQALIDAAFADLSEYDDFDVITNMTAEESILPASGTMVVERMLSGPPSGMEAGEPTEVLYRQRQLPVAGNF